MENLLRNSFTAQYGLAACLTPDLSTATNATYFEVDDVLREVRIYTMVSNAPAVYENPRAFDMVIINHDKFITSLPHHFQQGKKRCDLIVYTATNNSYFLLNELSDTPPFNLDYTDASGIRKGKKNYATEQLYQSLVRLMLVPQIKTFIDKFVVKRCCFFNKKPNNVSAFVTITAFNRASALLTGGAKRVHPGIEAHGFELFDYFDRTPLTLA